MRRSADHYAVSPVRYSRPSTLPAAAMTLRRIRNHCRQFAIALLLVAPGAAPAGAAGTANPPLPTVRIGAGMHVIQAEVARTAGERSLGLMNRERLEANAGMLFVFDESAVHCFWMRNTLVPLSIAFLDDDGRIVGLADMEPLDDATSHCPPRAVRHALEMRQGWFAQRGIGIGTRLRAEAFFGQAAGADQPDAGERRARP